MFHLFIPHHCKFSNIAQWSLSNYKVPKHKLYFKCGTFSFWPLCIHCVISDDLLLTSLKIKKILGLLCGMIVRNPSASVGGTGSISPGDSTWAFEAHVSQLLKPVSLVPSSRGHRSEKPSSAMKSSPSLLQLEKDRGAATKIAQAINEYNFLKMIKSVYHDMSPTNSREWLGFQTSYK